MLRLPFAVKDIFLDWLKQSHPDRFSRVKARIREMRSGQLNDSRFGTRMTGTGSMADVTGKMFRLFARKNGLDQSMPDLDCSQFKRAADSTGQLTLF
jgi:DNA repair photolyase